MWEGRRWIKEEGGGRREGGKQGKRNAIEIGREGGREEKEQAIGQERRKEREQATRREGGKEEGGAKKEEYRLREQHGKGRIVAGERGGPRRSAPERNGQLPVVHMGQACPALALAETHASCMGVTHIGNAQRCNVLQRVTFLFVQIKGVFFVYCFSLAWMTNVLLFGRVLCSCGRDLYAVVSVIFFGVL